MASNKYKKRRIGFVILLLLLLLIAVGVITVTGEINGGKKTGATVTVSLAQGRGTSAIAQELKDAGLILCTATSKPTEVVTPILEEKGLAPFFDFIGGASMDESRDTKTDVVHYVLSQPMLQGKRVLMVGDRNDDMRGAADCGLDAAGALYGYGSREELAPFHPVLLAESCADLADQLLEQRA